MSPEQLRSARRADVRSDIYSLGVILYECTTGSRPFRGNNSYDLMHAILTEPLAPPSALRPGVPVEFDGVVLTSMRRDPSQRFACARDMGLALSAFASDPQRWRAEFAREAQGVAAGSRTASARAPQLDEGSFTLASGSGKSAGTLGRRGRAAIATGATIVVMGGGAVALAGMQSRTVVSAPDRTSPPPFIAVAWAPRERDPHAPGGGVAAEPRSRADRTALPEAPTTTLQQGVRPPPLAKQGHPPAPQLRDGARAADTGKPGPAAQEVGTHGVPIVE